MKQVTGLFRCKRNGSIGLYGRYAERCTHGVPHTLVPCGGLFHCGLSGLSPPGESRSPARSRGRVKQISTFFFVVSKIIPIFACESITNDLQYMATTIIRKPASFRLRADLLEGLKRNAVRENRTLNNYVESVLLDIVYHEPNSETKVALKEAMSRKNYPAEELYTDVDEMFKALDAEV